MLFATAPDDYTAQSEQYTFNSMHSQVIVIVPIVYDNIDEADVKRFTVSLALETDHPCVTISPSVAEVFIEDRGTVTCTCSFNCTNYLKNNKGLDR